MSSREPLWFCHECHAEMRPLMVPDPACASCHGSFVEKMENAADDPRHFAHEGPDFEEDGHGTPPPALDALFFTTLQSLMDRGMGSGLGPRSPTQRTTTTTGPSLTFQVRGPNGSQTIRMGGSNTLGGGSGPQQNSPPGTVPNMSSFLSPPFFAAPGPQEAQGGNISGPLMAQYLMALLGHRDPALFGMPENGRMGDYVFNQEALDQIISQLMETTNAHRPVPATDDIIKKLPREVLLHGSPTLEEDCAVCKEQFKLETEDPDEQIVITLPCKHPFHQPCILPWLTSSGTCPVCRYALIPQPDQHPPNRNPGPDSGGGGSRAPPPTSPSGGSRQPPPTSGHSNNNARRGSGSGGGGGGAGFFQGIINGLSGIAHHGHQSTHTRQHSSSATASGTRSPTSESYLRATPRRNSDPAWHSPPSSPSNSNRGPASSRTWNNANNRNLPGGWADELD
ncbi:hypothetical protein M413DRAFT_439124 [Hebeloma cylindrosporum]|uniref:RING-type domain-containing protein n=1 Tax=Hebeloma cylindrosporum TaxID=76867 RepID=A0A0C3CFE0_HEBCY|nr:hypothetical protein M413DRAFT_439124 [Hebeloma cylindrosporum h7]